MINDFSKIYTFMEIVKERSFSKASKTLGISQPAVTLQIKKLEEILQATLIMRKKNGIILTREGEKFYKLCLRFESAMFRFKDEISHIKNDKAPLIISTTQLIGETFVPLLLDKISQTADAELDIRIKEQNDLIPHLKDRRSDIAMVLDQSYDENLIVKKLFDYEIILVSNKKLVDSIKPEELYKYKLIKDRTKYYLNDIFVKYGINYNDLKSAYVLDGSIMVKRAILNNFAEDYVAFLPKFLIEDHLKNEKLFEIKINRIKLTHSVYVAALKENEDILNSFLKIKTSFNF
ncbi:LysR family transcriptional regulator [Campylobacter sp. RM16187]|uniref:LysR family transcriptional regulator n=1 Tax=Campylobacter sp. RM16187 TaxID=1660063 RepID=UPI0021B6B086|nr:LysR family transcriptional regulator [Campylobacter sp. RM16187]QKG29604.1 transcriptional regulator, LysR family [Campylobacter sp. RM16187]